MSPLLIACQKGKANIAKVLIEHGAGVNATDTQQRYIWCLPWHLHPSLTLTCTLHCCYTRSPLWYAIESGMSDVSKMLIERGANVSHTEGNGRSLLWKAFSKDDVATAQLLLSNGASVQRVDYGDETLLFAALNGMDGFP